jgi:hypothetical protein
VVLDEIGSFLCLKDYNERSKNGSTMRSAKGLHDTLDFVDIIDAKYHGDASQKVCQIRTKRIDIFISSILPVRLAKIINMVSKQQGVELSFYLLISFDTRRYVGSCEV